MNEHGTKADEIAVALEEAIVSGELAPGTVLRQETVSERYGVSRTPVREALRRLAALGLVSFVPNRGVRVLALSRDELWEAYLVRAELESLATEVAATRMTDAQLDELAAAEGEYVRLTQEVRSHAPGAEDRRALTGAWMRANHGFHDVIYAAAAMPLVERLSKGARRTFSGTAIWAPDSPEVDALYDENVAQHAAIVAALRARSAAGVRSLAREHVLASFRLLETVLERVSDGGRRRRRTA